MLEGALREFGTSYPLEMTLKLAPLFRSERVFDLLKYYVDEISHLETIRPIQYL